MIYFDTSYLVKLYLDEPGAEEVIRLARTGRVRCSFHGRTELIAAFHRGLREGRLTRSKFLQVLGQFRAEEAVGAIEWLTSDAGSSRRAEEVYAEAGPTVFLRAADAMHLACAAKNGLREIYSNDRHLLAAAPLFKLKGKNIIL